MHKIASTLVLMTLATSPAAATTMTLKHDVLCVTGNIELGDSNQFARLDVNHPKLVVLDSEGGVISDAIFMATWIHQEGIATLIPSDAECFSACAMMFFAGAQRYMGEGATLGVHSARNASGESNEGTWAMSDFVTELAAAPLDVIYAIEMTPPGQLWILPRERWEELDISEWKTPPE